MPRGAEEISRQRAFEAERKERKRVREGRKQTERKDQLIKGGQQELSRHRKEAAKGSKDQANTHDTTR